MEKKNKNNIEIAVDGFLGQPRNVEDQINKFGTYEIQPTADSGNEFPEIAQGLSEYEKRYIDKTNIDEYTKI